MLRSGPELPGAEAAKSEVSGGSSKEKLPAKALQCCGATSPDIASRDLFYGGRREEQAPHGTFTFVEEDLDGSNPEIHR